MGPDHEAARRYYTELAPPSRLAVEFATQDEPRGTADAVAAAARFIDGELALVINGDNYYPVSALAALARMDGPATALFRSSVLAARGNIPPERVRAFAVCTVGGDGCLARIIEKPTDEEMQQAGADPLVSMNCWLVPPAIVEACRAIGPSARGEIELTHAVTYSIDRLGVRYRVLIGEDTVLDLSSRADVASVAAHLAGVSARP
jgi:glucose-1-phosphate thymidylyltransferase